MIVDCHTRIWSSSEQLGTLAEVFSVGGRLPPADLETHKLAVERLDACLVWGLCSHRMKACVPNQIVADYVRTAPHRLVGLAGIDPTEPRQALEDLNQAVEWGLQGVVIHPALQGFHPADTRTLKLYETCSERGIPIFFDYDFWPPRLARMQFASPVFLDEIARDFPALKMVLAHVGYPWCEETLVLLGKHPNLWAEISGLLRLPLRAYRTIAGAYELKVMDKLLFGSDFPLNTPAQAVEDLFAIHQATAGLHLPVVPREALRAILERDAIQLLGLRLSPPPPGTPSVRLETESEAEI